MKKCSKCKEEKPFEEFSREKSSKDGRQRSCRECRKQYYENNKEKVREWQKQWYENNREKVRERKKQYRENNKEKILEYQKQYRENNKEKVRKRKNEWQNQRYKNDPEFRLRNSIRAAFRKFLKRSKEKPTSEYLKQCGYTRKELMKHLENQFDQNMTWDNYGSYWHVDHIIPRSVFDPTNDQHIKWCWSLENLRPLEAWENMSKSASIILEEVKKISFYEDVKHLLKD
jgi:DNA repair exonuclease SbcCD ATPase subunit